MFGTLLNKLQKYIQIKGVKPINSYLANSLHSSQQHRAQAGGTVAERGLRSPPAPRPPTRICSAGTRPPPHQFLIHYHPIRYSLYIHETHRKVHTNKPRALLMQQALYNESKRARLLCRDGMSVQTLKVLLLQKNKLSLLPQPLDLRLPRSSLPRAKQSTQVRPTDAGQPLRQTVTTSVLCYSWTKA